MPEFDLAVWGGTIVTASDSYRADINIWEGSVISIGARIKGAA